MAKMKKKQLKIKTRIVKLKRFLKWHRFTILLFAALLAFPVIIGLLYRIPIKFIDVEVGDLLSFYAVALGLFATYLTYRKSEDQKSLEKQNSLRPRIELVIELNNEEFSTKVNIVNTTNNDYLVNYISWDCYEDEEKRYLNAEKNLDFIMEVWNDCLPQTVYVGIKDDDENEWFVGFERQEGMNKYCRTFIDPVG